MEIKLIYGSDTGNTEDVANMIVDVMMASEGREIIKIVTVEDLEPEDWKSHDIYFLGIPTWYDGELQSDWEEYFDEFTTIDFTGKTVALFGLGDQYTYATWFCDGIGILAKVIIGNGGKVIGYTEKDSSYDFETKPKALVDDNTFYGLCIDQDNQEELTDNRVNKWVEKVKKELES
jgi:flavodoxin I